MAIGYACLTVGVPGTALSRCSLKNATKENIRRISRINLSALRAMLEYNIEKGIKLFRISSDIIPFGSHPVNSICWWEEFEDDFHQLGSMIKDAGIRISMHPGQYTVLNSPDTNVVQNAVRDLNYHELLLSKLRTDEKSKLVIHIGGVYKNKEKAIDTFINNYSLLSEDIKKRLVIENDDKNYNIEDILYISGKIGVPAIFDNLHHRINPPSEITEDREWIIRCGRTWAKKDGTQKIHYSQQKESGRPGSHSDTISLDEFILYYKNLPSIELDIMLEVKDKNLSAEKCINFLNPMA